MVALKKAVKGFTCHLPAPDGFALGTKTARKYQENLSYKQFAFSQDRITPIQTRRMP
jgi:hypothetical protein